jgi:hypothetical protein
LNPLKVGYLLFGEIRSRRLWVDEGFRGVFIGQAVESEAARGKGDGDPALALLGAAEVEVPKCATPHCRQVEGEQLLVGLQVPEADRPIPAHGGKLATVGALQEKRGTSVIFIYLH